MSVWDDLAVEELPCRRLPKPDNSDGPTACLMRLERQRALWAMAHDGETATGDSLIRSLSGDQGTVAS